MLRGRIKERKIALRNRFAQMFSHMRLYGLNGIQYLSMNKPNTQKGYNDHIL